MADKSSESGYYDESTMKRSRKYQNGSNRDSDESDDDPTNHSGLESQSRARCIDNEIVLIDDDSNDEDPYDNNNEESSPDRHRDYENEHRDSDETERNDSESDVVVVGEVAPHDQAIELSKIRSTGDPLHPSDRVSMKNFKLLKLLGTGAYGEVFLVKKRDGEDEGQLYAMKILKKKKVTMKNKTIEHTRTEREVLEKVIDCPFLATLHYAFQTQEKLYLVMDFVQGGELFTHLFKDEHFSERQVRFYIAEIIIALEQLHKLNIIYRDIKLENILLDAEGHIVITDFGLSKEIIGNTKAYSYCGTIEYMAPEIVSQGQEGHDLNVDWWSVGVLTIELLTGQSPFSREGEESNQSVISERIKNDPPQIPTTIGSDARDLIEKLLKKRAEQRLGFRKDAEELKKHKFFKKIDWNNLKTKKYKPPKTPHLTSKEDVGQFAEEFTAKDPVESSAEPLTVRNAEKLFKGYSYVATSLRRHRAPVIPETATRPSLEQVHRLQREGGSEFFEQYRIQDGEEPIGDGTYSICMRCTSLNSERKYAVKIMNLGHDATQEIDALKVCQGHNNIVKLHRHLKDSHHSYLVFELLDGGELFSRIRDRDHFNEEIARNIFKQLIEAIKYMHGKDIVHRDLKPENIMFVDRDENSLLKLVDFGFARRRSSEETIPCYTLEYADPESLMNGTTKASRDMWSLGVILYTMLVGVTPFLPKDITKREEKAYRMKITSNIYQGNFDKSHEAWKKISIAAKQLIEKLLEVQEVDRYNLKNVMNHPWVTEKGMSDIEVQDEVEESLSNGFRKQNIKFDPETITIDDDSTELPPAREQREEVCSNDSSGIVLSDGNEGSLSSHVEEPVESESVLDLSKTTPIAKRETRKKRVIHLIEQNTAVNNFKDIDDEKVDETSLEEPSVTETSAVEEKQDHFHGFSAVPVTDIGNWVFALGSLSRPKSSEKTVYNLEKTLKLNQEAVDITLTVISNVNKTGKRKKRQKKLPKNVSTSNKSINESIENDPPASAKQEKPRRSNQPRAVKQESAQKVILTTRSRKTNLNKGIDQNLNFDPAPQSKAKDETPIIIKRRRKKKTEIEKLESSPNIVVKIKPEPVNKSVILQETSRSKNRTEKRNASPAELPTKKLKKTRKVDQPIIERKLRGRPKGTVIESSSTIQEVKGEPSERVAIVQSYHQVPVKKPRQTRAKKLAAKEIQEDSTQNLLNSTSSQHFPYEPVEKRMKIGILERKIYSPRDPPILSINELRIKLF